MMRENIVLGGFAPLPQEPVYFYGQQVPAFALQDLAQPLHRNDRHGAQLDLLLRAEGDHLLCVDAGGERGRVGQDAHVAQDLGHAIVGEHGQAAHVAEGVGVRGVRAAPVGRPDVAHEDLRALVEVHQRALVHAGVAEPCHAGIEEEKWGEVNAAAYM